MDHTAGGQDAQGAQREALAALLPELRAFARFLAGTRAEADDLVQEAVLRALRTLADPAKAAEIGSLRPWCLSVVRNVFHEQVRARRREARHREAGALAAEHAPAPAAPQEERGAVRDLSRALAALPPLLREALVLVGAQGMSHEDAAAVCRVPVGTMKARVSRARAQLAKAMGRAGAPA